MKKIIVTTALIILFLNLLALPAYADIKSEGLDRLNDFADAAGLESGMGESPSEIAAGIVKVLLSMAGVIFMILIIYAGYMWMTSAGNEERVTKAKKIIIASVIGLAIIITAYTITYYITKILLNSTGTPTN